jgi:HAD superfamily hydrolase (TIGR01509 family)
MPCPYALIIFDCDGVLVLTGPVEPRVRDQLLREQGIVTDSEVLSRDLFGMTNEQIYAHLETHYGAVITPEFGSRYTSLCYGEFETSTTAVAGAPEVVALVQAAGISSCVASNGPHAQMEITLRVTGLMPYFEGRVFSAYDVARPKPEPDLFLHAAKTLGFRPEQCVVIEDSVGGVLGGVAAGMDVLQFSAYEMAQIIDHPKVRGFSSMSQLPGLLELE